MSTIAGPDGPGAPIARFAPVPRNQVFRFVIGMTAAWVVAACAGFALLRISNNAGAVTLLVAVILAALSVVGWYRYHFVLAGLQLDVYRDGIIHDSPKGGVSCRFDDIESFFDFTVGQFHGGEFRPTAHSYRVDLRNGTKIKFDGSLQNVQQAAELIEAEVLDRKLPVAITDFEQGREVELGRVGISSTGIRVGSRELAWSEVARIRFRADKMSIKKAGGVFDWADVEYHILPNSGLLRPLLEKSGVPIEG